MWTVTLLSITCIEWFVEIAVIISLMFRATWTRESESVISATDTKWQGRFQPTISTSIQFFHLNSENLLKSE